MKILTAVKTTLTGATSFIAGLALWYGLHFLLRISLGDTLSSQEEMAFKVGYFAIVVIGIVLAVVMGWVLSRLWKLPTFGTVLVVLFLVGLSTYPIGWLTAYGNDCRWGLEFPPPFKVNCD